MIDEQWRQFHETLEAIGRELLPAAPDAETRIEGVGYLARLAAYGIERHLMGPERLQNGISFTVPRIGGYNPDYRIGSSSLDPARRYCLSGNTRGAYRIGVGAYSLQPDGRIAIDSYRILTGAAGNCDFAIEVATDADPESGLSLAATSNLLLIREIRLKKDDAPADFEFRDLEQAVAALPAPSAADVERSFTATRQFITGSLKQFMLWSRTFAARPNEITPLDPDLDRAVQGDPGTRYYSGYFHLTGNQALVIEIPSFACDYWGVQITSHWLEPMAASHLNHATAQPGADGVTRILVSASPPGQANWLATGGRARGAIFHRTINAERALCPACHLIDLDRDRPGPGSKALRPGGK